MDVKRQRKTALIAVGILGVIALAFSIVVLVERATNNFAVCSIVAVSQCQTVQTSDFAHIFGISNAYFGIIGYTLIILSSIWILFKQKHKCTKYIQRALLSMITIGTGLAIYFLYLQWMIIKAWCFSCIIVDTVTILMFIIGIIFLARE